MIYLFRDFLSNVRVAAACSTATPAIKESQIMFPARETNYPREIHACRGRQQGCHKYVFHVTNCPTLKFISCLDE